MPSWGADSFVVKDGGGIFLDVVLAQDVVSVLLWLSLIDPGPNLTHANSAVEMGAHSPSSENNRYLARLGLLTLAGHCSLVPLTETPVS